MPALIAYLRDSGGEEQELSLAQQEAEIRAWCAQRGYALLKIFRDEARPGSSTVGRDGFREMIRYLHTQPPIEGLVIWKYSRFARDVDDAAFYRADIRRLGYKIHSLHDNIPEGPEGRFFEAAIDWMNQRFLDDLSTDVKRGLRHLVTAYGCVPGRPPRGFRRVRVVIGKRRDGSPHICHRWEPDPELVPRIRQAWKMRAAGASLAEIQRKTALYRTTNGWHPFFRNKLYIGILEYGGQTIENYCQPIIDRATWDAVQRINRANAERFSNTSYHPRRKNSPYLLSGLAYCARCGSPLFGQTITRPDRPNTRDLAYRCTRAKRNRDCDAKRIPARPLEDAVLATLRDYILHPDNIARLQNEAAAAATARQAERAELLHANRAEQRRLRAQIDNLAEAIAALGGSSALLNKLRQAEARLAELTAEAAELQKPLPVPPPLTPDELAALASTLVKTIQYAPAKTTRQILRGLIHRITVDREGKIIRGVIEYHLPQIKKKPLKTQGPDTEWLPISPLPVGAQPKNRPAF